MADAGYGTDTYFRDGLIESGLPYVVGIQSYEPLAIRRGTAAIEAMERAWSSDLRDPS